MKGLVLLAGGLAAWHLIVLLGRIHREMMDQRASFTYVAELAHAQAEHERLWTAARNGRVGGLRPLERPDRWNAFFVEWAGE